MRAHADSKQNLIPGWLALVRREAESLNFGAVQIKVQNGAIVRIESTNKSRINPHE